MLTCNGGGGCDGQTVSGPVNGNFHGQVLDAVVCKSWQAAGQMPKIYFRDTGPVHSLLGIANMAVLVVHPRLGAAWEGFALEQTIRLSGAADEEVFFWGVHNQGELDLLLVRGGRKHGFEIKYTNHPKVTSSHRLALECLALERLEIVCPGAGSYPLEEKIHVTGLGKLPELFHGLSGIGWVT